MSSYSTTSTRRGEDKQKSDAFFNEMLLQTSIKHKQEDSYTHNNYKTQSASLPQNYNNASSSATMFQHYNAPEKSCDIIMYSTIFK